MVRRSRLEDNFARRRVVVQQTVPLPRLPQTWLSLPEQSNRFLFIRDASAALLSQTSMASPQIGWDRSACARDPMSSERSRPLAAS